MKAVEAAKTKLAKSNDWLLILDNADDIAMVSPYLVGKGDVLLTTRAHAIGTTAKCIDVKEMGADEGAELLLRRAKIDYPTESDRNAAREITTKLLDGFPLALDQAGAYIEETGCGLEGYLQLYKKHAPKLLARRGQSASSHPDPVATTWSLSFANIQKANPAASDLLRLCAFLAPDAIPIEILGTQIAELELEDALREVLRYSLLTRDPNTRSVEIHRLVQQALKYQMSADDQCAWAARAVRAVNDVFPDPEFRVWPLCERLLPQALAAAALISEHKLEFSAGARLMNDAATYLKARARYAEAEPLFKSSLAINETLGDELNVATLLNNLANLHSDRGEYDKAESLYQRAIAIDEKALGPDHPNLATGLNNLAVLHSDRGDYDKAEPLYLSAIAIDEAAYGPRPPRCCTSPRKLCPPS